MISSSPIRETEDMWNTGAERGVVILNEISVAITWNEALPCERHKEHKVRDKITPFVPDTFPTGICAR